MVHDAIGVRAATADDAGCVASLLTELGYAAEPEAAAARLARLATGAGDEVLVAVRAGRVCGLASVHIIPLLHRDGALGRITSFVVAQPERRRGVGAALLAACAAFARERGAERLELTSGDRRADAHAFYAAHGFEREGTRLTRWLTRAEGA